MIEAVPGVGVVLFGYPLYLKLAKSQHQREIPVQAVFDE